MLTLLWGLPDEEPLAAVACALAEIGGSYFVLDQRRVLETEVTVEAADGLHGTLRTSDRQITLDSVRSYYVRPYDTRRVPDVMRAGIGSSPWQHALAVEDALLAWLEMTSARVVNRPSTMLPNGSKPYQLEDIQRFGFRVPETLVTTNPEEAEYFWRMRCEVIYKSISGVRSRVARMTHEHKERLADICNCPTQFQAYVPGTDFRVHVIGDDLFACEIQSGADDYRYAASQSRPPTIFATILPLEVRDRCVRMTSTMNLLVAGIDLRRTPEGEWYCFEVNPSPAFTYYESQTGQPIAAAIARLLVT